MSDRILVTTRKGLFILDRTGGRQPNWEITRACFVGDNVPMALPDRRDGTWYAALNHGHFGTKLHRSSDAGERWEEATVPEYPPKPADVEEPPSPMGGKSVPWNLELLWCLEAGGRDEPGVIWAGTIPGGLFKSIDSGKSWDLNRPLWDDPRRLKWFGGGYDYPGIHSICVDPTNSKSIRVGVSCGGVWTTTDGGEKWECRYSGMFADYMPPEQKFDNDIQDPHRLAQCAGQLNHLWVQHHNGIFRSTDGGATWQHIDKPAVSGFGFAVAVHPRDGNTAWFVPGVKDEHRVPVDGKLVVTRTRDGGRSFDVLSNGLPGPHAYDLVFRHALDIDEAGNRLVFGSTTGSLWVSENQGDQWNCVSTHLPPIYCTRFV